MSEGVAAAPRHCLRRDLVIAERVERGKPFIVAKDPRTGRMYGFNQPTYQIMKLLDGQATLDDLPRRVREQHGVDVPAAELAAIVDRASRLGLLEAAGEPAGAAAAPPSRLWAWVRKLNPFYIRIGIFDPTPILRPFDRILFPLFTRWGALAFAALLLFSCALIADAWHRYLFSFFIFTFFDHWLLLLAAAIACGVLHEFGHVTATRAFGGEVKRVGVLVYFLHPTLYANVNDSWMFTRGRRAVVGLAGVYVEATLWCAAIITWYFTRPYSQVNQFAFVLAAVLMSRAMINLFPLLRFDGYFVLSDALGIHNLRPRAFAYWLSLIPVLGRPWRRQRPAALRDQLVLLLYGAAAYGLLGLMFHRATARMWASWGLSWEFAGGFALLLGATSYFGIRFLWRQRQLRGGKR